MASRDSVARLVAILTLLSGCSDGADLEEDGGQRTCESRTECDDGVFCNGEERCDPASPAANPFGCLPAVTSACMVGQTCNESETTCITECATTEDADGDGVISVDCGGDDCDDSDPNRFPGNAEVCDAEDHDEDCDPTTFGDRNADGDAFLDDACCNIGDGEVFCGTDCDDTDPGVNPETSEACDGVDNDCDDSIDEAGEPVNWYEDSDGDSFGTPDAPAIMSCAPVAGRSLLDTDCDDTRAAVNPAAREETNGRDDDCDGRIDEAIVVTGGGIRVLPYGQTEGSVRVTNQRLETVSRVCGGTTCVTGGIVP